MGAEIIFGVLLAVLFTIIGSATVYQAVMLKEPVTVDGQIVYKRLTPSLMIQLIIGCIYIFLGIVVFGATVPVVREMY